MSQSHRLSRRQLLEFLGYGTLATAVSGTGLLATGCSTLQRPLEVNLESILGFKPLPATLEDAFLVAEGFQWYPLISWNEPINSQGELFGFNNDFIAFHPLNQVGTEGIVMVNHEYPNPIFTREKPNGSLKSDIVKEQKQLGVSLLRIRQLSSGKWEIVPRDPLNRRVDGTTKIPFSKNTVVAGSRHAIGTFSNCAGGQTPWGTFLTCEENYDQMYGDLQYVSINERKKTYPKIFYGWNKFFDYPPEHYGWVVEINPLTGQAKKLTSLGRFFHESATVVPTNDGRVVVYSGDDSANQCLYKFVASQAGSLDDGELFVAQIETGKWLSLDYNKSDILKKNFKNQLDVLINTRAAAHMVGGTPLDRPEDIERDPKSGAIIVALTNNKEKKNFYGSLLKIVENGNDPRSKEFSSSTLLLGGPEAGLACPDNLTFDAKGGLWVCTDMSGSEIGKTTYAPFGNNSLYYIPTRGPAAGRAHRVASGPVDAELMGPCFSPDGKTLFLCVQHPGEYTVDLAKPTSRWPTGSTLPRPTMIALSGPALEKLTHGT